MMQNNFYFLKHLSQSLQKKMRGMELATCFTQNKDELILGFCRPNEDFYIRASLEPSFTCLNFLEEFHRAKKNTVALFIDLIGAVVSEVHQFENDRSFALVFEDQRQLVFKMHGSRSNILLWEKDKITDMFLKKHVQDWELSPTQLNRPIEQTWERFLQEGGYKKLYPTFNKNMAAWVEQQMEGNTTEQQWEILQKCIEMLDKPVFYVGKQGALPVLSLIDFENLEEKNTFSDALEAINTFYYGYTKSTQLDKEKHEALKELAKQEQKANNYINKTSAKLAELEQGGRFEEIANILMANLHQIPAQSQKVTLFDFYENKDIEIKLKADLSPQKNAEVYYRKAKNSKIEIDTLKKNLQEKQEQLEQTKVLLEQIKEIEDIRSLRKFLKENLKGFEENKDETSLLFKKFTFQNFTILVGKNAKNNDLLTQRYTYKEDLWLHAKDVSGSHVVIKYQAGKKFPEAVIEKAAQLAAFYSKRKNDSLCPVIVIPKKYVRKPKGLANGQVVLEKEEVIMVEPQAFSS